MTALRRTSAARAVVARAYAKINLDLRVLGRRPDGYHELRTVFQSLALHDTLVVRTVPGPFRLESSSRDLPADESNLVWRAAAALWRVSARRGAVRDVTIELRKRIPMQAGLGGGSSDAAATLLALNVLWELCLPPAVLADVAATLGSDVPFFLLGGTALGVGRGEQVYPLPDIDPWTVVLVRPPFGVRTAEAYGWLADAPPARRPRTPLSLPVPWHPGELVLQNDLETAVCGRFPAIARLAGELRRAGAAAALMAGSGSTVFGLFERRAAARQAAAGLARPGHLVTTTRVLLRSEWKTTVLARTLLGLPRTHPIG